ncbi:MAG TPA: HNH endonuclease [Caulobacteraceae bacterium]|nr:HNH endonuclease [Caulobacteraceae bacterium]
MVEAWREYPIDPRYEVSDMGRVRRKGASPRRPHHAAGNYPKIVFSMPGSKPIGRHVHTMVLETFIGPRPPGAQASHINGAAGDARLVNLAWETISENNRRKDGHGTTAWRNIHHSRLTPTDVAAIRTSVEKTKVLAAQYGVTMQHINLIRRGGSWKWIDQARCAV